MIKCQSGQVKYNGLPLKGNHKNHLSIRIKIPTITILSYWTIYS